MIALWTASVLYIIILVHRFISTFGNQTLIKTDPFTPAFLRPFQVSLSYSCLHLPCLLLSIAK